MSYVNLSNTLSVKQIIRTENSVTCLLCVCAEGTVVFDCRTVSTKRQKSTGCVDVALAVVIPNYFLKF